LAPALYNQIFFTNILRILDERGLSKHDLSERAGVSISFLSDLTNGKANPSLRVMSAIAAALDAPLPALLEWSDLDQEALDTLADGHANSSVTPGYERVWAVLPSHQAYIVRRWHAAARTKRGEG